MRDIDPSPSYSQGNEAEFRREVVKDISSCYNSNQDVFVTMEQRLAVQATDGLWYRIVVAPGGALSTTPVTP